LAGWHPLSLIRNDLRIPLRRFLRCKFHVKGCYPPSSNAMSVLQRQPHLPKIQHAMEPGSIPSHAGLHPIVVGRETEQQHPFRHGEARHDGGGVGFGHGSMPPIRTIAHYRILDADPRYFPAGRLEPVTPRIRCGGESRKSGTAIARIAVWDVL
jgi:hypothetical protein